MAARSVHVTPEPFLRFAEFVAAVKQTHTGRDLAGEAKSYVPLSALCEYWTPENISGVLRAFSPRLDIDSRVIRKRYLRIFSTLAYTGHETVQYLQPLFISRRLTDDNLPLRSRPSQWPNEKIFQDAFNKFVPHQWQFFPLHFHPDLLQDLYVDNECILPIDYLEQISHSSTSAIKHIAIHDDFNDLEPRAETGVPRKRTFVFKVYHTKKSETYYETELRALQRLSVYPSENVVKFYGSFRQAGECILILEYVDGGDLGKFFDQYPAPKTHDEAVVFWKSLFQVFLGLDRIHKLISYNDETIRGIHEDIRPENILVLKGSSGSPYDFTPKIADFGLYSRVRTAKARASGSMGLDNNGNSRFSSPECCHHTTQRTTGSNMITTSSDIFSMGAVLSHAAAWVIGGPPKQKTYFQSRRSYHEKKHPRFIDSGYEGCFHDSIEVLPVVKQHHAEFRERCRARSDRITPEVLNCIEECMLRRAPKDRLRARDIEEKFAGIVKVAPPSPTSSCLGSAASSPLTDYSEITTSSPFSYNMASPSTTLDVASPPLTSPSEPNPELDRHPPQETKTLQNGHGAAESAASCRLTRDDSRSALQDPTTTNVQAAPRGTHLSPLQTQQPGISAATSTNPSPVTTIGPRIADIHQQIERGQPVDQATADLVEYLEYNLGGRDQFFFIDDSLSMSGEKDIIIEGFRALASIAERLDPNEVELAFATRPRKVHKAKKTTRLQKLVANCQYRGDGAMMEHRLGELFDYVIIPRLPFRFFGLNLNIFARKEVSIYVFTDGDWGSAHNSRDACGVEGQVKRLIEELKRRRLSRTQVSLHFVRFGNKENGRLHLERLDDFGKDDSWDIVDVKHINTEVESIFKGPITRSNDEKAS